MLELEAARAEIFSTLRPLPSEMVPLSLATGRIIAQAIPAAIELPPFDNSAMDGYAVRASDVRRASEERPVPLELIGQTAAGEAFGGELQSGACVRVFTGSMLPAGADAVVMQEDTRIAPGNPRNVLVLDDVQPWENVRVQGEDVKRGSVIAQSGDCVTAGCLALLAALGVGEVEVARRPVVGLLATGSELLEAGQTLGRGKVYESNRIALASLLDRASALPKRYPLVPDSLNATEEALSRALAECDAILTSGGVSVGELDFVKAAWEKLGGSVAFWKVAIRPGKPFVFGRWREKFLFGLPGNPVSALVTFLLLVRPALLRWQGASRVELASHSSVLAEPLVNRADRRHFMRVTVDERGEARLAGAQTSHMLRGLVAANGLVDVPPRCTFGVGTTVRVMRIDL